MEKAWALGYAISTSDLLICADGNLGWDLTTGGVEMDLVDVFVTIALLTSDRDNLVFLLLEFENENSWYWKLPLEDALVSALGMNYCNFGLEPDVFEAQSRQVL